jgi:glutathione synthase/RimK-type ligase-like ATP-grasp enzyme
MATIKIIGKRASKAVKAIRTDADIRGYTGKTTKVKTDALINYGLASKQLETFYRHFPSARKLPVINRFVGYSKYNVAKRASDKGIPVPETKISLSKKDDKSGFIEKRTASIGGKGIIKARGRGRIAGKYYQKFIGDRRYELRVHAFLWIPQEDWRVQKRVGPDNEIAWNYKNGGHFISIHRPRSYKSFVQAEEIAEDVLNMLGMSFGAVDFLVDSRHNVYFIEVNSAPGFTELSRPIYVDAFSRLKKMRPKDVLKYTK